MDTLKYYLRSFHFGIFNHLWGLKMNESTLLYVELDKMMEDVQRKRCEVHAHQGLMKMIIKHIIE